MIFKFENIGIVKKATIEVKGLTVITGLNDTGKSFISKSVYSIIKTLNNAERFYLLSKYRQIAALANKINNFLRQNVPFTPEIQQKYNRQIILKPIGELLFPKGKQESSIDQIKAIISDYIFNVLTELRNTKPSPFRSPKQPIEDVQKEIEKLHQNIISVLDDNRTDEQIYKAYFDEQIIQGVFQSQFNSVHTESKATLEVTHGVTRFLNIEVGGNTTESLISENFSIESPFMYTDATIIETPAIVQFSSFITNTIAFFEEAERGDMPPYFTDLVKKLQVPSNKPKYQSITDAINKIISGGFKVNESGEIIFVKNNVPIRSFNIASGIKSFGLIQMLLNSDYINETSLLIIDEPEVHLHPDWGVEYGRIIVELSKIGIPIIISSHSPYLLEAISVYSKNANTTDITKFYFGQKSKDGTTTFEEVTNNLDAIFRTLSSPMQHLFEQS